MRVCLPIFIGSICHCSETTIHLFPPYRSDGVYETFVLGQGEFNQINIQTGGVSGSIYADKPIMVVMFMKSQDGAQTAMVCTECNIAFIVTEGSALCYAGANVKPSNLYFYLN